MYYDSREESFVDGNRYGGIDRVSVINGTAYTSKTPSRLRSESYPYTWYQNITDYSPTRHGRFTLSSGTFPDKYAQSYKPVKNRKVRWEIIPGIPTQFDKTISYGYRKVNHDGRLSSDTIYWAKPEWKLGQLGLLEWPAFGGWTDSRQWDWARLIKEAPSYLKEVLNDQGLLNQEQIDMGTFLAELRDIKNLASIVKINKHHTDISDKFLGLEFGVLPMVGDIEKIYNNVKSLRPNINIWNKMSDKGETRSEHRTIYRGDSGSSYRWTPGFISTVYNDRYWYNHQWAQNLEIKAHIYVRPKRIDSKLDLQLQASLWGLNKPLRTVWNVIPYSFAVDWVVDIGDLIDRFEYSDPKLQFEIVGAGISVSLNTEITTTVEYEALGASPVIVGSCVKNIEEYYRCPVPLDNILETVSNGPIGPLKFKSSLTGMQLLLSAALAHQKFFK